MTYLKHFAIENFRIFPKKTHFDFAPITILTGKNNSGKSSLIKAILMLQESFNNPMYLPGDDTNPIINVLRSETGSMFLGVFDKIRSKYAQNAAGLKMSIPIVLKGFPAVFTLTFTFEKKKGSQSEGFLMEIQLFHKDTSVIHFRWDQDTYFGFTENYIEKNNNPKGNFLSINGHYLDSFLKTSYDIYKDQFEKMLVNERKINFPGKDQIKKMDYVRINFPGNQVFWDNYGNWMHLSMFSEEDFLAIKSHLQEIKDRYPKDIQELYDGTYFKPVNSLISDCFSSFKMIRVDIESNGAIEFYEQVFFAPLVKSIERWKNEFKNTSYFSFNNAQIDGFFSKSNPSGFSMILRDLALNPFNKGELDFIERSLQLFDIADSIEMKNFSQLGHELFFSKKEQTYSILEMGFGSSQITQLIFTVIHTARKNLLNLEGKIHHYSPNIMMVEEPESNLHPDYQSKLADFFILACKTFNIQFIIETHSEYLIRKLQYLTANKDHEFNIKPEDTAIYYFNDPKTLKKGEEEQIIKISIEKNGSLSDSFGPGFIDEASTLKFDLLRLNRDQHN